MARLSSLQVDIPHLNSTTDHRSLKILNLCSQVLRELVKAARLTPQERIQTERRAIVKVFLQFVQEIVEFIRFVPLPGTVVRVDV